MSFPIAGRLLLGALAAVLLPASEANTCLIMYQLADNNLEYFIRQDYQELTLSPAIRNENMRTHVYYDALNQGGAPLPNTVDQNGNPLTGTFTGAQYVTYNRALGAMQVNNVLSGEPNSDALATVQSFLEHALDDCLSNGFTSLMAVFSSHAGGFAGYGGDENKGRLLGHGRNLLQPNRQVANAVRTALANVGGPDKLDVIGFDACNMMAFEAADDYFGVADYLLASEALEPGHGWSYTHLSDSSSALALSQQVVNEFLIRTQGGRYHQVPKTLALLDLNKYEGFLSSFESFSADALSALQSGDVSLHAFMSRARTTSVTFEGILDTQGSRNPSCLDIGSWMTQLAILCTPSGSVGEDLVTARTNYREMFVVQGTGPGTSAGTGMHIVWPNQGEYFANKALFDTILFQNSQYVTAIAPNFRALLAWFLNSQVPAVGNLDNSVCGPKAQPPASLQADPNALIISDTTTIDNETSTFHFEATIGTSVSQMVVEYAIDLSTALKPVLIDKQYTPADDEYILLKGGDVTGYYEGSKFVSTWDQNFYFLNISGTGKFEALYTYDAGDQKRVPVMYFPEENRTAVGQLQFLDFLFFKFDYWLEQGARFSYLTFSVNETEPENRINDNLALFISNGDNGFSEHPKEGGGMLMPLVYIDAYIQGRELDTLPGGFNQTIIEWKPNLDYNILTTSSERIFEVIPSTDAVVVNCYAYNHGNPDQEPDIRYYDVIRRTRSAELFTSSPVMGTMAPGAVPDAETGASGETQGEPEDSSAGTTSLIGVKVYGLVAMMGAGTITMLL